MLALGRFLLVDDMPISGAPDFVLIQGPAIHLPCHSSFRYTQGTEGEIASRAHLAIDG